MRTFIFLFCVFSFALGTDKGFSQDADIVIENEKTVSIKKVFRLINKQTGYKFIYRHDLMKNAPDVRLKKGVIKASELLHQSLKPINFTYSFLEGKTIIVKSLRIQNDNKPGPREISQKIEIKGTVKNAQGEPLPGANVIVKGTTTGATTDFDGNFTLSIPNDATTLVISYIGFITQEVAIGDQIQFNIVLEEDSEALEQVVVTGFSNPRSKLESSVAISTLSTKTLKQESPQSAASLMKFIPGFVLEPSGGAVGNNLYARGIPSGGGFVYVQLQEDGIPVFEDQALQFGNGDNWLRVDETIAKVEGVRGGSASIFATNAPGGIINFISKTGTNDFKGDIKFSTSDFGLLRTDVNLSGPLVEDKLFYSIGGFYRQDQGVRDPGFTANNGGQFKGNLLYKFDNGYAKITYKKLNDRNIFYLPIPLQNPEDPEGVTGFNPNYGTLTSANFRRLSVPQPDGGTYDRDLQDGIHPNVNALGGVFKFDINDNLSVKTAFRNTDIDLVYNAIFTYDAPTTAQGFAEGIGITNPIYENANNGEVIDPSLVAEVGFWGIDKQMHNLVNNFQVSYSKEAFNVTLGHYYSNWKSNQQWNWSDLLIEATDNPTLLDLRNGDLNPGDDNYSRTYNGVYDISRLQREGETQGIVNAIYLNTEIEASKALTLDLGLRYDMDRYQGYRAGTESGVSLGIDETQADDNIVVAGGPFTYWDYDINRLSFSIGANYNFNDNMAVFARASSGFRGPTESVYYGSASNTSDLKETVVKQYEVGYKLQSNYVDLFATLFYMDMDNIAYTRLFADGSERRDFAGSENLGVEIEGLLKLNKFTLSFKGTSQDPILTNFDNPASGTPLTGNNVRRIPKVFYNVRPTYNLAKDLDVFANWGHYGSKFINNENTIELPGYDEIDFGANYSYKNVSLGVNLKNAFNAVGLTEGNPRVDASSLTDIYYARPIFGRHVLLNIAYNF